MLDTDLVPGDARVIHGKQKPSKICDVKGLCVQCFESVMILCKSKTFSFACPLGNAGQTFCMHPHNSDDPTRQTCYPALIFSKKDGLLILCASDVMDKADVE